MKHRCPRCGSTDVMASRTTLPAADEERIAWELFCRQCKLSEGAVEGEPRFDALWTRWKGSAAAGSP